MRHAYPFLPLRPEEEISPQTLLRNIYLAFFPLVVFSSFTGPIKVTVSQFVGTLNFFHLRAPTSPMITEFLWLPIFCVKKFAHHDFTICRLSGVKKAGNSGLISENSAAEQGSAGKATPQNHFFTPSYTRQGS